MLALFILSCAPTTGHLTGLPDGVWYWGDLHAHSGWSWDGCEVPEADCALRQSDPADPGADFFDNAIESGLSFAALTDHAEADRLYLDGLDGEAAAIWPGQQALVQQADAEGRIVAVLGYEWTAFREERQGSSLTGTHRTVLLSDPDACADYRVSGWALPDGQKAHDVGEVVFTQDSADFADTPAELWAALSAAEQTCGSLRWLTFAHHPAYEIPQVTDWTLADNEPEREQVVEIYSEHGSSECYDLTQEGCDWRVNTGQRYYPDGSIHAALAEGYRLGFVGGTDSHDARPGSLDDGPSHLAHWEDTDANGTPDTPKRHFTAGGLTGVWMDADTPLTATSLLETVAARTTVATSGPRPSLIVAARGSDGQLYRPGSILPRAAMPAEIIIELTDPGAEADEVTIERIGPDGILSATSDATLIDTWRSGQGDWTYLRLRYTTDGDEERVWVSPWFEESRNCGCGSPASGPWWLTLLALWIRRRSGRRAAS